MDSNGASLFLLIKVLAKSPRSDFKTRSDGQKIPSSGTFSNTGGLIAHIVMTLLNGGILSFSDTVTLLHPNFPLKESFI